MKRKKDPHLQSLQPQNVEAEESILSAILIDNRTLDDIIEILTPDDFYRTAHKEIFSSITDLYAKDEPIDLVTLSNKLKEKGRLEEIGGASYLAKIVDTVPLAMNAKHYARIICDKSTRRRLIGKANEIINHCFEEEGGIDDVMNYAERSIFDELSESKKTTYHRLSGIIQDNFDMLESRQGKRFSGIPSGFTLLDNLTSGFQDSDLIILAARPGMGKTAFALNIARNMAVEENVPVAIFSFEMSKEQLGYRLLCAEARVNSSRLRDGFLSQEDWVKLTNAAGVLSEAPIFIDDSTDISALDIRAKSRRLKIKENIGLIIIDYLQLMESRSSGMRKPERRDLEIAEISRAIKGMAKELKVPVLALSQLNRMLEQRSDKRPMLSDLRESGALEQDADLVVFIYRDEVYNKEENNPNRGIAEIILSKHRNGQTGIASLAFLSAYTRFENMALGSGYPEGQQ
ncbi:replicative DNA helicase [Thermodesulfobacteriota bacterium]